MPEPDTDAWARDPETLEAIFHAALREGDAAGVEASLRLLLACAPTRALHLYDKLSVALTLIGPSGHGET